MNRHARKEQVKDCATCIGCVVWFAAIVAVVPPLFVLLWRVVADFWGW